MTKKTGQTSGMGDRNSGKKVSPLESEHMANTRFRGRQAVPKATPFCHCCQSEGIEIALKLAPALREAVDSLLESSRLGVRLQPFLAPVSGLATLVGTNFVEKAGSHLGDMKNACGKAICLSCKVAFEHKDPKTSHTLVKIACRLCYRKVTTMQTAATIKEWRLEDDLEKLQTGVIPDVVERGLLPFEFFKKLLEYSKAMKVSERSPAAGISLCSLLA